MTRWPRRNGDRRDEVHLLSDTDARAAAIAVAEAVRAAPPDDSPTGELEDIEVVYVGEGQQLGQDPVPGLRMTWRQGTNRFGLLNTVRRLAEQAGGLDALSFYLRLAVDEPHGAAPDDARLWFMDLPTAPY